MILLGAILEMPARRKMLQARRERGSIPSSQNKSASRAPQTTSMETLVAGYLRGERATPLLPPKQAPPMQPHGAAAEQSPPEVTPRLRVQAFTISLMAPDGHLTVLGTTLP